MPDITDLLLAYFLITDAYSHKIVGHNLAETMEAIESVKALEIAVSELKTGENLIHHSDRGTQYCSGKYVKLLQEYEICLVLK